jgi:hypothetical protein
METYAKAAAPVDKGFHRRNIRHDPGAPFLTTSLTAFADYAGVLEFGFFGFVEVPHHVREIKKGKNAGTKVPVDSHIRPMIRAPRPHIVPAAERALKQLEGDLSGLA